MGRPDEALREEHGDFITILVCGGRDYKNSAKVYEVLNELHLSHGPIGLIINGGAAGADYRSTYWAKLHGIPVHVYHAQWEALGKRAGPIRNALMLKSEKIDIVVAFPGKAGTADMIKKAKRAEITTWEVSDDPGTNLKPSQRS